MFTDPRYPQIDSTRTPHGQLRPSTGDLPAQPEVDDWIEIGWIKDGEGLLDRKPFEGWPVWSGPA